MLLLLLLIGLTLRVLLLQGLVLLLHAADLSILLLQLFLEDLR